MAKGLLGETATPNEVIADRFCLVKRIGNGGMGSVFLAYDQLLKKEIALKILRTTIKDDKRSAERLLKEAELMRELRHPNLVHTYDVGLWNDMPYFTMEYVGGGDLARRIKEEPLPWEMAISVVKQMAQGLAEVHHHNILHRDLKLSNILIDGELIKISDFGLAYNGVSDLTKSTEMVGSPASFPPELIKDRLYSHTSDIYALGVASYELITGTPPFRGDSIGELIGQILHVDPPPPHHLVAIPEPLSQMVMSMLHKNPSRRPSSAHEIATSIKLFTAENNIPEVKLRVATSGKLEPQKSPPLIRRAMGVLLYFALSICLSIVAEQFIVLYAPAHPTVLPLLALTSLFFTTLVYGLVHWRLFQTVLETKLRPKEFLLRSIRLALGIYAAYVIVFLVLAPRLDFATLMSSLNIAGRMAVMSITCILSLTPLDLRSWLAMQGLNLGNNESLAITVLLPTFLVSWDALQFIVTTALCRDRLTKLKNENTAQQIIKRFFLILAGELILLEVMASKYSFETIFTTSVLLGITNMLALYLAIYKAKEN
jgi:serine/threonine protein kinase